MTRKAELISAVRSAVGISEYAAAETVNAVFDQITNALARDEKVNLLGFGCFERRHRRARQGRNPRTGEVLQIAASNSVGFKPGKTFKEKINT